MSTEEQFQAVIKQCRDLFEKKMQDYGTAWRVLRPSSMTDQIYIKINRIRTIQEKGVSQVDEGVLPEFIGIVNYAIMGIVQLRLGVADGSNIADLHDMSVLSSYDAAVAEALNLMRKKNHDYDEAWRLMRISSLVDLMLMKVFRTKQIEDNKGKTLVSEGVRENYMDMLNYAVFALIRLLIEKEVAEA